MRTSAFTLAELLIALAILGVIATFAIPKVLQAREMEKNKALFRETLGAISAIIYRGHLSREIEINGAGTSCNYRGYLEKHLNMVKICNVASSGGCWDTSIQGGIANEHNENGFIMHNGAVVVGLNFAGCSGNGWGIDINGPEGPNEIGKD